MPPVKRRNRAMARTAKRPYEKPALRSERMTAVAALCNGTNIGGRKASTSAPDFCSSSRLKS